MRGYPVQLSKTIVIVGRIVYIFFEVMSVIVKFVFMETPRDIFIKIVLQTGVSKEKAQWLKNLIEAYNEQCADYPHLRTRKEKKMGPKFQSIAKECRIIGVAEWRINWVLWL